MLNTMFNICRLLCDTLTALAEEINKVFKDKPAIYFSKGLTENGKRLPSTGKFLNQLNYVRKLSQECGLATPSPKVTPLETNTEIDQHLQAIRNTIEVEVLSEEFKNAWKKSFLHRVEENAKSACKSDIFQTFPVFNTNHAFELIVDDFNKKFLTNTDEVLQGWPQFKECVTKFINSKNLRGEDFENANTLSTLPEDKQDILLTMLLSGTIKTPEKKNVHPETKKGKLVMTL